MKLVKFIYIVKNEKGDRRGAERVKVNEEEEGARFSAFKKIRHAYQTRDKERLSKGQFSMGETSHGFWGTTNLNDAWILFKKINLEKRKGFLDLGSGDGRIVAVANLFTKARGIEGDKKLVEESRMMFQKLGIDKNLIKRGEYQHARVDDIDTIFSFPDKNLPQEFLERLSCEFSGKLYIYTNTYPLNGRKKSRTIWVEQLPVLTYTFNRC